MVLDRVQRCADIRERLEATKFDSLSWQHLFHLFTLVIDKEPHFSFVGSTHEHIFLLKSALLDKYGRGNLCRFVIKVGFDDEALRFGIKVFFEIKLFVGDLDNFLFEKVQVRTFLRTYRNTDYIST